MKSKRTKALDITQKTKQKAEMQASWEARNGL